MSLGPKTSDQQAELSRFDRISFQTKKVVEEYFENPIHHMFFGMLALTIIGLFFGMEFSWKFYAILLALAGARGYWFLKNQKDGNDE